jgi:hypothetical protein
MLVVSGSDADRQRQGNGAKRRKLPPPINAFSGLGF